MGSRTMHLAVAKRVLEKIEIEKEAFYYGNLIPDAHKDRDEKLISHFAMSDMKFSADKFIEEDRFILKYKSQLNNPVYLGYLAHLITDDIWLRNIYVPVMVDEAYNIITSLSEIYYSDFGRMNYMLIKHFDLDCLKSHYAHNIEEVNTKYQNQILKGLKNDFKEDVSTELLLFNWEKILAFIETSSTAVISKIKELRGEK